MRHGKGSRIVPIFPELLPYLEAAKDAAPEGAIYVIPSYRSASANLWTNFERIIGRAGVKRWVRLFHNLRASRQTELANDFAAHVVSNWMGNTVAVADAHYLMTTEEHFQQAIRGVTGGATAGAEVVQKPVPQADTSQRTTSHSAPQVKKQQRLASASPCVPIGCENVLAPPVGLEQLHESPGNTHISLQGGATAGAVIRDLLIDPELQSIIAAWPSLPDSTRAAVLAIVRGAKPTRGRQP